MVIFIVTFLFMGSVAVVPAMAEGPCPINYSIKIKSDGEYPILEFEFINTSILNILETKIEMDFYSEDNTLLKENAVVTISNLNTPGYFTHDSRNYYLRTYPKLFYVSDYVCKKVIFADNSEWVNNKYSDPKANFLCQNPLSENKYIADKGVVRFLDTSQNSSSQKWFYWDDTISNWTQFGNAAAAELETELTSLTIKLEINGDPNFYEIKTIDIAQSYIAIVSYATEEVIHANREFKFKITNLESPYMFGFWDFYDSAASRKWFCWNDSTLSWEFISSERGPSFLLESQYACIKLEYNEDPFNFRIIEISTHNN